MVRRAKREILTDFLFGNLKGTDDLEDPSLEERITNLK
jgi:hypothetical protein